MKEGGARGIEGAMTRVYDVFVDWPGRLARELPGIERLLASAGARRVLDLGCGTGKHVEALLARGWDAHGADASEDMLARARKLLGPAAAAERLHRWRLGDPAPATLAGALRFDAAISLGNTWPFLVEEREARAAVEALRALVRPGGLLLLGLKAFEVRRRSQNPYLPLLRRMHEGRPLWFVRFVDFEHPPLADDVRVAELHMAVLAGDAAGADERGEGEALLHRASRLRSWDVEELRAWLVARGLERVRVSGKIDDPDAPATSEDVFASARFADAGARPTGR